MKNRKLIYWICQFTGWTLYVFFMLVVTILNAAEVTAPMLLNLFLAYILGLSLTHLYRGVIIRFGWLSLNIYRLIPRVLVAAVVFGVLFYFLQDTMNYLLWDTPFFSLSASIQFVLTWSIICLIWSSLYFSFHFFENYRKEEIKNLQWEATRNEVELNNLKAQLNPHFMFNAMNSIRALVDDDPDMAKQAITQLSNILRNTLLHGRRKLVTLEEEMHVVRDYLSLESVRYEERLRVDYDIDEESLSCFIPPLMVQTIVENGIKHGISKLPEGGVLKIHSKANGTALQLQISNSGTYVSNGKAETGIGLKNTEKRLSLLYGEKASFEIYNDADKVVTNVILPKQANHENDHH